MSYLDWYLSLNEGCREKGYNLALLVCPDPDAVIREIIPRAVEIACKNARKQNRRDDLSRKHWKMYFSDPQLFQISVLEASQNHAKQGGCSPANWLTRYIGFLSLCTLQRNSFYVAVGFQRILNTGSAKDILELYEWLSYRISPDGPPIGRDEKSANDICSCIHEQIYKEFEDSFQTDGHKLMFDKVPKGSGGINDEVYRILDKMIPWETDHLPAASQSYSRSCQRTMAEMSLAHVCIDQQRCLEDAKRGNQHISRSFDAWRLPIPNIAAPAEPPDTKSPRWPKVEEEIMKEIHWSEEKSKRGWGTMFEIVVDGEIKDIIECGNSARISLPPVARYMEIRDAESKIIVANCHLMDPHDLTEVGWKSSVKVPSGGKINFQFDRDPPGNEMAGLSVRIGVDAGLSAFIRNRIEQFLQPRFRAKSLAWIAASLALALTITLIVSLRTSSGLRGQVSRLQQEKTDLQAQVSTIPDLEAEIAELQQPKAQEPDSSPREALYDGSALVLMDEAGNLRGVESISQRFQQMIGTAIATGEVETPDLRSLGGKASTLMGEGPGAETFSLVGPVGVVIQIDRPKFRWKPLSGATSYAVIVSDSNYNEVAAVKSLFATQWRIDRPLERGKVYSWQVTALKDAKEIKSPNAPGVVAKFQVLDRATADDLEQARKANSNSHLVMGTLYAKAGLLDEAEREFKALFAANPRSTAARKLLLNVEALKRGRR